MKQRNYILLVISHAFLGVGFFFLYIYYVRSIFETRTHFTSLSHLERESLLLKEDALYFSFYKTITDEPNFLLGYEKLKNVTTIEYPNSVNVLKRFHVLPELVIGYLFHSFRRISRKLEIPIVTCWTLDENPLSQPQITCDGIGEPFQFYLEFVWVLGGFTIFIMYMYGAFLSENIFGGIYAVVSYIMFHKNAAKIYDRPIARENFAFPFIFWQMFYLCLNIDRESRSKDQQKCRPVMVLKLTILTTISLLCWQFSSIIFATQILIMIAPSSLDVISVSFSIDYSISQLISTALAYYFSFGNKKFFFAWQNGPVFSLFYMSLYRMFETESRKESTVKYVIMGILLAICSQTVIIDLLEMTGFAQSVDNPYVVYRDLILQWGLQHKVNFTTSLLACNSDLQEKDFADLWQLLKTMFVKPYCLYGVVVLAKFFRKWRIKETKTNNSDNVERAKNYVLEDFLEENHISMKEMSNKETEKELNDCWKLLEECDFDYEKYITEKTKTKKDKINEHDNFMNDIKRLKQQINKINEKKNNVKSSSRNTNSKQFTDIEPNPSVNVVENKELKNKKKYLDEKGSEGNFHENTKNIPTVDSTKNDDLANELKSKNRCSKTKRSENNAKKRDLLSYHYLYSITQLAIFAILGLSIRKLFFLCYTQGCVIAPTLCTRFWYHKQRNIFWTISLAVFLTSIADPGFVNIHKEYYPTSKPTDTLESMLEWINMNTEKDAVFGGLLFIGLLFIFLMLWILFKGPVEIIGTVHLVTKRPIVNHAHLEMSQISDRTEHVYSVFSRQQSSDIYTQCSQLKIQYLIISIMDCSNLAYDECDILTIWDDIQPAYRKYPQFCSELTTKNVPSFLKVFSNEKYGIIKMFSQSLQINLKYSKMPEKVM